MGYGRRAYWPTEVMIHKGYSPQGLKPTGAKAHRGYWPTGATAHRGYSPQGYNPQGYGPQGLRPTGAHKGP